MTLFWFLLSVYLVFGLSALWQAEVRTAPGRTPTLIDVVWASLRFALARPVVTVMQRLTARG